MAIMSAERPVFRPPTRVSVGLEFSPTRPVPTMRHLTDFLGGLLRGDGRATSVIEQGGTETARIETDAFVLYLRSSGRRLFVVLERRARHDSSPASAEAQLARLIRAAGPVLCPSAVHWFHQSRPVTGERWMSSFRPVRPRRVVPRKRTLSERRAARGTSGGAISA